MEIVTARLLLREFRLDDEAEVHAFAADPQVTRHTAWGPLTPSETAAEVRASVAAASVRPRIRYGLAVTDRATGAVAGSIELRVVSDRHRRATLDFAFGRPAWGRGYATEAAHALVGYGFATLDLRKVTATCSPDNLGSHRVLTKIGMRQEGYLHDHILVRDTWQDRLLFGLVSPDAATALDQAG
ncbi:GNAT family N-acetyltransferase [Actinoplanes couchii]|uniref:N-acetyltransferase n=1 Tax=Actinoplanes couchii TaxID=403638 RepID=A0ABQ3XNV7_9ACTN|nr:GNAT family N-acetyltransferase [Actinoplanes couchii]MDR6318595.1 RimJ/RimL family protein N-acetyltransferase [Actinoplanes couchii]GID60204.1 N-acetyltransferase [Actinoplanes couchii]